MQKLFQVFEAASKHKKDLWYLFAWVTIYTLLQGRKHIFKVKRYILFCIVYRQKYTYRNFSLAKINKTFNRYINTHALHTQYEEQ